ncbi:MAG: Holliday junction resolvase RuvX, partial [Dehalococcoidales bacterium]|nr:Holliday junction resolvase RuvX [Dehalococcoidales bacterium]
MRAMALDVGQRRIGIALSDPDGSLAYARGVIKRGKLNHDLDEIAAVVEEIAGLLARLKQEPIRDHAAWLRGVVEQANPDLWPP